MRLSIYTCVRDGRYHDYHVVPMVRHHLPLADEVVVHIAPVRADPAELTRDRDDLYQYLTRARA